MLLTVDIGNTHIIIGGFQIKDKSVAQTPSFIARFLTEHRKTDDQYAMAISQLLSLYHIEEHSIQDVIICSVVPELSDTMKQAFIKVTGITPMLLGPGIKTGLNIRIDNPLHWKHLQTKLHCSPILILKSPKRSLVPIPFTLCNPVLFTVQLL